MIRDDDLKALAELSSIVSRYGPDSITRLADLIRDPRYANDIATALEGLATKATALEGLATKAPDRRSRQTKHKTDRIGMGVLNDLRERDPSKHSLVAEFRERLISGTFLKTMPDIRRFARTYGLTIGSASSRNAAIAPLLKSISELETAKIAALLESYKANGPEDRSLERWRELIVKPNSKQS